MDPLIQSRGAGVRGGALDGTPAHLAAVDESTRKEFPAWGMMVGRQEGRFLELLVFAAQATSVLEIGTFTGYSSIAMAAGLPRRGSIISLEVDPHHATTARGNIAAAGLESQDQRDRGAGPASLEELSGPYDLVFIDADKVTYDAYYEAVLPKLAPHGLIVVDNTLQGGVLDGERPRTRPATACAPSTTRWSTTPVWSAC
jgi:caffeoyl-CoA O-methyltransferase